MPDPAAIATSTIVVDRDGRLLRPFTIADGRWRLPVTQGRGRSALPRDADRLRGPALRASTTASTVQALLRAAGQFVLAGGHIVSGGSTLTMQVARLLDGDGTRSARRQAPPDRHGAGARSALQQGPDPRPLPHARALWRQHRGHPRREPRLFRQGADAADARRGGAARRAAAIARGAPARPRPERRARRARPRARPAGRRRASSIADAAAAAKSERIPTARRPFPMLAAASRPAGGRRASRAAGRIA